MLTSQYVRLTPDERSKEGSIWNHQVSGSQEDRLTVRLAARPCLPSSRDPSLVYRFASPSLAFSLSWSHPPIMRSDGYCVTS